MRKRLSTARRRWRDRKPQDSNCLPLRGDGASPCERAGTVSASSTSSVSSASSASARACIREALQETVPSGLWPPTQPPDQPVLDPHPASFQTMYMFMNAEVLLRLQPGLRGTLSKDGGLIEQDSRIRVVDLLLL